ncbi:MAG TPA: hypothetical protein VI894_01920 [Candidatus Nanoarchaeia archaeon]|nr:hypothetical protein [Candidatus Nanoarchaeia archaeon]
MNGIRLFDEKSSGFYIPEDISEMLSCPSSKEQKGSEKYWIVCETGEDKVANYFSVKYFLMDLGIDNKFMYFLEDLITEHELNDILGELIDLYRNLREKDIYVDPHDMC